MTRIIKVLTLTIGMASALPAIAATTYTYTDPVNNLFSGSFTVANTLADGTYSFAATKGAGFAENFFTTSFVGTTGANSAPSITRFDVSINNAQVSAWDIVAKTYYTAVTRTSNYNVYHAAEITYTISNLADSKTYDYTAIPYQTTTLISNKPGTWSAGVASVPLPPAIVLFASALFGLKALNRKMNS